MTSAPPAGGAAVAPVGVALIHGLARSTGSMWLLAQRLERAGFATARIGYPSTRLTLGAAVEQVAAEIGRLAEQWQVVHLVGHSLGGVVARLVLERHPELPIGRVVQLGSPNRGSVLAEKIGRLPVARRFFGPVLDEITHLRPKRGPRAEIGAIAGRLPIDPVGFNGVNDGFVAVSSALGGAGERAEIASVHGWMPLSPEVGRKVIRFLKHGRFGEAAR